MKVEAWLVVKAKRGGTYNTYPSGSPYRGQQKVTGGRVVKIAQNKPSLQEDEIAFELELDVDESWFLEGTATIQATIPAAPQNTAVIPATVNMPIKGRAKSAAAQQIGQNP